MYYFYKKAFIIAYVCVLPRRAVEGRACGAVRQPDGVWVTALIF